MGTTGVCGGEGAQRAAGGGVLDLPSPSVMGPEPLRTEPSRSANFAAAEFGKGGTWRRLNFKATPRIHKLPRREQLSTTFLHNILTKSMLGNVRKITPTRELSSAIVVLFDAMRGSQRVIQKTAGGLT